MSSVGNCIACGKSAENESTKDALGRVWHPDCMAILAGTATDEHIAKMGMMEKRVREVRCRHVIIEALKHYLGYDDMDRLNRFEEALRNCKFEIHETGSAAFHMLPDVMDELERQYG